jgi:inositol phosphorylceramide mannosyltransferase catalytic subunit
LIPKQIFTGISSSELINDQLEHNYKKIRQLNPGWAHEIFTNEMQLDFMEQNVDTRIFEAYLSLDERYGAARTDLFKYSLLYLRGGVWLDAKSTSDRSFDEIIQKDDHFLLSHWPGLTTGDANELFWADRCQLSCPEFINWVIISEPGHLFLEEVINQVVENISTYLPIRHGISEQAVLGTTGPLVFTNVIFRNLHKGNYRLIKADSEGIKYSIFPGMEHRSIINSHYHGKIMPLISRGFIIDCGVLIALFRMYFLKFKRKVRKFVKNLRFQ